MDQSTEEENQLWKGRQSGPVGDITVEIGESISLDIELYREDIYGSAKHAGMLRKIGILNDSEYEAIIKGLRQIKQEVESGQLKQNFKLEDIHTHVETRLIELIKDTAKKLHTARSRNDQVALDTHLFVRRRSAELHGEVLQLCEAFLKRAGENREIILPGYTHLQPGQPVRLSHHNLAYFWSFARDAERFAWSAREASRLPLGSGAMAGVNYDTDRDFLKQEMEFADIYPNSMDAVSSRDHIMNFLFTCSNFMVHGSRLAEEIILWNSVEYSFITLPDSLTTGSSLMPQKKNPDLAELVRGKAGRVAANLQNLSMACKGLPLTYNRDLQEDRFPLLDSAYQTDMSVRALRAMVETMTFHPENMKASLEKGYVTATDLADALVLEKNIPFREAHHIAGELVGRCVEAGVYLSQAPTDLRKDVHPDLADDDFYARAVDMVSSADKKISYGGTALKRQEQQLDEAAEFLEGLKKQSAGLALSLEF